MPELPEVETVRAGLDRYLPGKRIVAVKVLRADSIGFPSPAKFVKALTGHTFADILRRGKYLIFRLDGGATMVAHLRMSGRLLLSTKAKARSEHIRVYLTLSDKSQLIFEDMRVFGRLWYVAKGEKLEEIVSGLVHLGVEPLELLSAAYLQKAWRQRRQAIKSALLDQSVIAGIGNIYADESLYLAGIHPTKPAGDLTKEELHRLCATIVSVLRRAIELGGSSLRNYTDSQGVNGNYQSQSLVYGRHGKPCQTCGKSIERIKLAGRSSHFCPYCQRERRQKIK